MNISRNPCQGGQFSLGYRCQTVLLENSSSLLEHSCKNRVSASPLGEHFRVLHVILFAASYCPDPFLSILLSLSPSGSPSLLSAASHTSLFSLSPSHLVLLALRGRGWSSSPFPAPLPPQCGVSCSSASGLPELKSKTFPKPTLFSNCSSCDSWR